MVNNEGQVKSNKAAREVPIFALAFPSKSSLFI
jgi:hypothetical protein